MRPALLIRIDCIAGLVAGTLMLSLRTWLAALFALPAELLLIIGLANLAYGAVALSLAWRSRGGRVPWLRAMAAANLAWATLCVVLAVQFAGVASPFGMGQLVGEALLVAGLGVLEWRAAGRTATAEPGPGVG